MILYPKGGRIREEIESFWRSTGPTGVGSLLPHIGRAGLWNSGHPAYQENMLHMEVEDQVLIKRICLHIAIYKVGPVLGLPFRWAELGCLPV